MHNLNKFCYVFYFTREMNSCVLYAALIFGLVNLSDELSFWSYSPTQKDDKPIKRDPPKSCPYLSVTQVPENYQGNMGDLWIVTHIIPRGKSHYSDGSPACGLYNFASDECKCVRYSISLDENDSIIRKTVGLEVKSHIYRYTESRVVFIEDDFDVFQAQYLISAATNYEGTNSTLTSSPKEEEIYVEYIPFALIATDNYETYAVYASCVPSTSGPLFAWIAFANESYIRLADDEMNEILSKINKVLAKNGIDYRKFVPVDQQNCRPKPKT